MPGDIIRRMPGHQASRALEAINPSQQNISFPRDWRTHLLGWGSLYFPSAFWDPDKRVWWGFVPALTKKVKVCVVFWYGRPPAIAA